MRTSSRELAPDAPPPPEWQSVVDGAAAGFVERFGLRACRFEPFPFDTHLPRIEPGRIVVPAPEPGIGPCRWATGIELPVRDGDLTIGRFVLFPASSASGAGLSPRGRTAALARAADIGRMIATRMRVGAPA